jgi:hypothetical protein
MAYAFLKAMQLDGDLGTITVDLDAGKATATGGHTVDGFAEPELSAPGRYMWAHVPTASELYQTRPDRIVAPGVLELSGTSFAAPVIAGTAANLLALHPDWTPDEVKGALMAGTNPAGAAAPLSAGVGEVWGPGATALTDPPNPNDELNTYLIPDPDGGPTPVFDAGSWGTTVENTGSWGTGSWGTGSWGTGSWGTGSWGTSYWESGSFLASGSWGTSVLSDGTAEPADNESDEASGSGYWMTWPRP